MNEKRTREQVRFRLARLHEAEPIAGASRRLIEYGLPWWCWTPKRVRKSMRSADTVGVVAQLEKTIAGFALMHFGEERAHLYLLAVEPEYRRRGVGTGLVVWLEESCSVAGITHVLLEVRAVNQAARRFYQRLGYEEGGRVENYYCGQEAAIRMVHDLRCTKRIGME